MPDTHEDEAMDVVLYARLSEEDDDPTAELQATKRQLRELRAFAEAQGHRIVAEYEDDGVSAFNKRKPRPAFKAMLADLDAATGSVGLILCWKLDRLLRQDREALDLIDLALKRNLGIVSLYDPGLDLTTPTGRFMFKTFVNMSLAESETISLRQRAKARAIAETGRPSGGGIRPFGLRRLRDEHDQLVKPPAYEIVPDEAELVAEAARRILAADSLWSIVSDWDRRGVRTPGSGASPDGRKWEVSSLKRMITAPRIAGDRVHRGQVTGSGHIPPLLDRDTYDRVSLLLAARRGRPGRRTRVLFLTGLAHCGKCGARLQPAQVAGSWKRGAVQYRYSCRRPRGCGGVSVLAKHLEPFVSEAIATALESDGMKAALEERAAGSGRSVSLERLQADKVALEELNRARYVEKVLSDAEYRPLRSELQARIDEARRRLEGAPSLAPLALLRSPDFGTEWEKRDATGRHEIAKAILDRVVVGASATGGRTFDPGRVSLQWAA